MQLQATTSALASGLRHDKKEGMHKDKLEVQKQWDNNPCGAETGGNHPAGSLEYFRAIRHFRYRDYAPWMDEVVGFSNWQNKDVLEIGVGMGSDHFRFAQNGNRMTALDLSREHLRQTQQHLDLEGLSTDSRLGDAENMPFSDSSFDLVYTFGVIHHTPNTEMAVDEIYRVLRPGGTAIVAIYHRDSFFHWISTVLSHGVLELGILRKGWRTLISEVEYRDKANGARRPLVKVYSRRGARRLFGSFSDIDIQTAHVEASHLCYFNRLLRGVRRDELERRFHKFGWFLVIKATKPPATH